MSLATIQPNTDAWLAARRKGIGASEIAAVLGISPWESPFSLYWRKVGGWEFEASPEMEWGTRLEEAIAAKWEDNHPLMWARPVPLQVGPEPWMLATPDRGVGMRSASGGYDDPWDPAWTRALALLELKTAHSVHDGWGEPNTAEIPVHYRAQVQWQMAVTGAGKAFVAVLIGGSNYCEYVVQRDKKDIAVMVEAGRRFMARIANGDPPPLDDHHATLTTLKRLHPELDDDMVQVDERVGANYLRACRAYKLAEKAKDRYEILLRAEMGRAKRAAAGGRRIATRTVTDIAESTVTRSAHRRDYLSPAKEKP